MKELLINEFISVTEYGASNPVIVKVNDGKTYVLKTRYQSNLSLDENGMAEVLKDASLYIETLSYLLLQEIGFKYIPEIVYINIDDTAIEDAKFRFSSSSRERDKMALENIENSKGLNLGVRWIDNSEGAFEKFGTIPKTTLTMAINYDAYVMNVDRHETNPNILFSKDDNRYYLIDFGNAFDSLMIFEDLYINSSAASIVQWFEQYVFDMNYLFFNDIQSVVKYTKKFSKDDILNIMQKLPSEWKPNLINDAIAEILSKRVGSKEVFEDA